MTSRFTISRSIAPRIALVVGVLLASVPMFLLALESYRDGQDDSRDRLVDATQEVANVIGRTIMQGRTMATALAVNGEKLLALPPNVCGDRLRSVDDLDPLLPWNFSVADAQGNSSCSVSTDTSTVSLADRDYFQDSRASGALVLGSIVIGKRLKKELIPIVAPILDGERRFLGVVQAGIPTDWLIEYATKLAGGAPFAVQLYDNDGQLLVDQAGETARVVMRANWHAVASVTEGDVQVIETADRLVGIAVAWPDRFKIAVIVDKDAVLDAEGHAALSSFLGAVLALLVGLGWTWWMSGRMTSSPVRDGPVSSEAARMRSLDDTGARRGGAQERADLVRRRLETQRERV